MPSRRDVLQGTLAAGAALGLSRDAQAGAAAAEDLVAVRRRRIPSTGELVPCVGLGTSRTLDVDPDGDLGELVEVMRLFLAAGGSLVDSSPMYGRAEAVVGRLLQQLGREDVFFATKVWTKEGKQVGIEQMATSERLMGARRIDLMQIHNLVDYATHLETLRAWKAEGRLRYIGATEMRNFEEVERILREDDLDFIQIPHGAVGDGADTSQGPMDAGVDLTPERSYDRPVDVMQHNDPGRGHALNVLPPIWHRNPATFRRISGNYTGNGIPDHCFHGWKTSPNLRQHESFIARPDVEQLDCIGDCGSRPRLQC